MPQWLAHKRQLLQIKHMANALTLARIALIAPFVAFFLANTPWNMTAALVIFMIASLTDFLDGWIARARGEVSALGAALDPLADKLLIAAALILLLRNGVVAGVSVIAILIILLREILVSGLREAVSKYDEALPVTGLAKWKTTAQLVAAGALLAAAPGGLIGEPLRPFAIGILWVASVLTFWTGAEYTVRAARILREKDR